LTESDVDDLVAGYEAGATVYELAERFGIHRATVSEHLHRRGVGMRGAGLREEQVEVAVRLYEQGWSLARTGARLGCTGNTVRFALLRRGVRMRDAHGRER
jgi:DNA-binding CsgD family transcriptional regulator